MARKNDLSDMWCVVEVMEVTEAFRGKSFSITGHLGRKRDDIVSIIETAGGSFHKQPDWNTTYLITNRDWTAETVRNGASKKLIRAQERGTKIISEATFCNLLIAHGETAATDCD